VCRVFRASFNYSTYTQKSTQASESVNSAGVRCSVDHGGGYARYMFGLYCLVNEIIWYYSKLLSLKCNVQKWKEKRYILTPIAYKMYEKRLKASKKCTADKITITHFEGDEDSATFNSRSNIAVLRQMATSHRGKGVVIVSDSENSSRKYTVKVGNVTSCECNMYHLDGIVCKHIIIAANKLNIDPMMLCHEKWKISNLVNMFNDIGDIKCQIPVWDEIYELEIDKNCIGPKHNLYENEEGELVCDGKCGWCDEKQPYTGKRRGPHQNRRFANRAPLDQTDEMRRINH
jgi:hypothetical protein